MRTRRALCLAAVFVTYAALETDAVAAERWIDRPMTQRRLVFAGDVGVGLGHAGHACGDSCDGFGLNLEGALGITDRVELGFRTGLRFDNGRAIHADEYGRTLWTENYGTGADVVANPELRVRWVAYSGSVAEVGLDGRVYLPVETGTRAGIMFGVPLAFHVSDTLRIDTGVYIPILFYDNTFNGLSVPGYFWFQISERLWLGPMAQLSFIDPGPGRHQAHLEAGFGLGYQVASAVDLKTMFLMPALDDHFGRRFGAGFGVQFRIGE